MNMSSALIYFKSFFQVLKLTDLIDILLIAFIVYQLLKSIKETRAMQLVKGILILFFVLQISSWFHLNTLNYLLRSAMQVGMFAIVVIFQPELRSLLEKMGRSKVGKIMNITSGPAETREYSIRGIVKAALNLSESKTGALIVIERETKLGDVIGTGTLIDAEVSSALLENIFVPNTPLHDGAVIIRGDRIHTAGCFLPLTSNENLSRELGTRHRAALGVSEASDALVIVVSEETGKISIAANGALTRNLNKESLTAALQKAFFADGAKSKFRRNDA
ncbi:MAG TPA: TIGR00159 family protein [Clostridiales bacterium]|nr:TIGR00159 family protein [Clostridiales bacterium]